MEYVLNAQIINTVIVVKKIVMHIVLMDVKNKQEIVVYVKTVIIGE